MNPRPSDPTPPDKTGLRAMRYVALVTQLPFTILAGYGLGYALDYWLGTAYLRTVCLLAGVIGGFAQLVRELMKDAGRK